MSVKANGYFIELQSTHQLVPIDEREREKEKNNLNKINKQTRQEDNDIECVGFLLPIVAFPIKEKKNNKIRKKETSPDAANEKEQAFANRTR